MAATKAKAKAKTMWVLLHTSVNGEYVGSSGDVIEMDNDTAGRFIAAGYAEEADKPAGVK